MINIVTKAIQQIKCTGYTAELIRCTPGAWCASDHSSLIINLRDSQLGTHLHYTESIELQPFK